MTEHSARPVRVSVAMTTYNGARYLKEQIDSILACLADEDELVISDDGSRDETRAIIASYEDPRIVLVDGPCAGIVRNFENALMHCRGDYIFLSDQDDIWCENKVSTVLPRLTTHMLVCHNAEIFEQESGNIIGTTQEQFGTHATVLKTVVKNSFIGCCMAFRRELLALALPFPPEEMIHIHDWWLGLMAIKYGSVYFMPEKLIRYRIHGSNTLGLNKTGLGFKIKKRVGILRALRKYGKRKKASAENR